MDREARLRKMVEDHPVAGAQEEDLWDPDPDDGGGAPQGLSLWHDQVIQGTDGRSYRVVWPEGRGQTATFPFSEGMSGLRLHDVETGQIVTGGNFITGGGEWFDLREGRIVDTRRLTGNQWEDFIRGGTVGAAGAGGRTFGEDVALLGQRQDFEAQEAEKNRRFTEEQNRLADAMGLTQQLLSDQRQADQWLVETLGRDPFRAATAGQGRVGVGTTPSQAFRGRLSEFAEADVPRTTPGQNLQEIEGVISQQEALIAGQPQRPIGLAHGGSAGGGALSRGVLVGEAGPEVVRKMPDGRIEVIPLVANAQGGGVFDVDGLDEPDTGLGRFGPLAPIFQHLGFEGAAPLATRTGEGFGNIFREPILGTGLGFPGATPGTAAETFGRLGTRPRLVFVPEQNAFFSIDAQGQTQAVGDRDRLIALGGNPEEAVFMPQSEFQKLGFGANVDDPFKTTSFAFDEGTGTFGERQPIFMPFDEGGTRGIFLPDPAQIANLWPTLDLATKNLVISAYGMANFGQTPQQTEAMLNERFGFFTPRGTATAAGTARLG